MQSSPQSGIEQGKGKGKGSAGAEEWGKRGHDALARVGG